MRAAGPAQVHALLPTHTGAGVDAAGHGQDRCFLPGGSMQRQPPDGGVSGPRWDPDQPGQGAKPHAPHGVTGDLPETPHHGSRGSLRTLSLPGGCQHGHGCGSGVGYRYHLHPTPEGLPLPGGRRGSLLQTRAQLEALQ